MLERFPPKLRFEIFSIAFYRFPLKFLKVSESILAIKYLPTGVRAALTITGCLDAEEKERDIVRPLHVNLCTENCVIFCILISCE